MIAAKPEWEFAGLYADEGISGTRADKRPQFQKMINDCLSGKNRLYHHEIGFPLRP